MTPKPFVVGILAVAVMTPQLVLAAWWNPLSWIQKIFNRAEPKVGIVEVQEIESGVDISGQTTTIFYFKYDNSRVRACGSVTCEVVGYYPKNYSFTVDGKKALDDLPEWIYIDWKDGDITKHGYINKSLLSTTQISNNAVTLQNEATLDYSRIEVITQFRRAVLDADHEFRKAIIATDVALESQQEIEAYLKKLGDARYQKIAESVSEAIGIINEYRNNLIQLQTNLSIFSEEVIPLLADPKISPANWEIEALFNTINSWSNEGEKVSLNFREDYESYKTRLLKALDPGVAPVVNTLPVPTYQPRVIPQLNLPKTTYCTMSTQMGGITSIICN